jgi:hypothetical protein
MDEQKRGMTGAQKVWLWLFLASVIIPICIFGLWLSGDQLQPSAQLTPTMEPIVQVTQPLPTPTPATIQTAQAHTKEAQATASAAQATAVAAENKLRDKPEQQSFPPGVIVSILPSLISLIGFISTTALNWRKEAREAQAANFELEKMRLELERARLEIEKQRISRKEGEKEDDDKELPDWLKDIKGNDP